MKFISRPLLALLLLGLPAVAAADADTEIAQCTEVSTRFHGNPHSLSIGDLDVLRSCVNRQQEVLRADLRQSSHERRVARASLQDDL